MEKIKVPRRKQPSIIDKVIDHNLAASRGANTNRPLQGGFSLSSIFWQTVQRGIPA